MSNFFKSKTKEVKPSFTTVHDPYSATRSASDKELAKKVGKAGPKYDGETAAPMSDAENRSLGHLKDYENRDFTQNFKLAEDEISNIFNTRFDPESNSTFQAVKAAAERNLAKSQERIKNIASGKHGFFSGARVAAQQEADTDATIGLNQVLAQLGNQFEDRRFAAVDKAMELDDIFRNEPLNKAKAAQTLGALPREIQQRRLDAEREIFDKSELEYPLEVLRLAVGAGSNQPTFAQNGYTKEKSGFEKTMDVVGPAAKLALAFL